MDPELYSERRRTKFWQPIANMLLHTIFHIDQLGIDMSELPEPLGGPAPPEVPLPHAPLERVLAQVQFPEIIKISTKANIASFQDQIRTEYPRFKEEKSQVLQLQVLGGAHAAQTQENPIWRFLCAEENWRVSLTSQTIAIEVKKYTSRDDFLSRWCHILALVESEFSPNLATRLGMRYIDRVKNEEFKSYQSLFKEHMMGPLLPQLGQHIRHSINEASLKIEEGQLLLRWGLMPGGGTFDPDMLTPIKEASFVLDIDVFSTEQTDFRSNLLRNKFEALAKRAYSVFRFVINEEEFMQAYGAKQ